MTEPGSHPSLQIENLFSNFLKSPEAHD